MDLPRSEDSHHVVSVSKNDIAEVIRGEDGSVISKETFENMIKEVLINTIQESTKINKDDIIKTGQWICPGIVQTNDLFFKFDS